MGSTNKTPSKKPSIKDTRPKPDINSGYLFVANIVKVYPAANTADLDVGNGNSLPGVFIHNYLASVMGMSKTCFPEAGSSVLCLKNRDLSKNYVYIIGTVPDSGSIPFKLTSTFNVGTGQEAYPQLKADKYMETISQKSFWSDGLGPIDMVEGEFKLENNSGVGIGFFNSLAQLKGGDLAKVECFLMDDLVRIMSMQFQQISSFGEYKILNNDGALNVVWRGTSNEYETWGQDNASSSKDIELAGDNQVKLEIDPDKDFKDDAKWRFQQYIGKLGSFIHTYVTDPKSAFKGEEATSPSGRFHKVVNMDGSYLVQSTSDIAFEHVYKIPIPESEITIEEMDFNKAKVDAYTPWIPKGDFFESSYEIRDYSRWFSNYYSMAGFLAMKDQKVKVPTDNEIDLPDDQLAQQNIPSDYSALNAWKYSTIRIFRDGTILLLDGYGSSVHLTNGNINISAALDVNINAGNTINLLAKNINGVANDSVDFTSVERGINLKSKYWIQEYCEAGPILIQSDRIPDEDDPYNELAQENDEFAQNIFDNAGDAGIIVLSNYADTLITAPTGTGALIVQNKTYVNNALYTVFTPQEMNISEQVHIDKGTFTVDSSIATFYGTVMADSVCSESSVQVATTGQDGLMFPLESGDLKEDNMAKKRLEQLVDRIKDLSEEASDAASGGLKADEFKDCRFKYIPDSDTLLPKYSEIYQPITQNLIKYSGEDAMGYNPYEDIFGDFDPNKAGSKEINYPLYPGNSKIFKEYKPKLMTQSISQEVTTNELNPNKIQGSFLTIKPTFKALNTKEVKLKYDE